jgi:hypothetical protein
MQNPQGLNQGTAQVTDVEGTDDKSQEQHIGKNRIPPRLSPSQANMYLKCGVMWEFRYIDGLKIAPGGAMIRGRALDEASNVHYLNVATTNQGLQVQEFVQLAVDAHGREVKDGAVLDMPEVQSKDIVAIGSEAYYKKIASQVQPRSKEDVQKRVEWVSPLEVPIVGVIDLVIQSPTRAMIIDTKFKGKFPSQNDVDNSIQLTTYAMMESVPLVGLAIVKPTGETKLMVHENDQFDYTRTDGRYRRIWDNIQAGKAIPAIPGTWYCSQKWCGYWSICPYGAAGRGAMVGGGFNSVFDAPTVTHNLQKEEKVDLVAEVEEE